VRLQRNGSKPRRKVSFKCKWCGAVFYDRAEAERHGSMCGMEFEQAVRDEGT
jgi:transposase-like protein